MGRTSKRDVTGEVYRSIDSFSGAVPGLEYLFYSNPEPGFREWKTAAHLAYFMEKSLGVVPSRLDNIPYRKATLDTGRPGPSVAILAELDAITCENHPGADKETGAAHACGHHTQLISMLGAMYGLIHTGALAARGMAGRVHFIAVPAEECIDLDYRRRLKAEGKIRYLTGKTELLARGVLDDCDMFITLHLTNDDTPFSYEPGMNGIVYQRMDFRGKASHAAVAPEKGVNAQIPAARALLAIDALKDAPDLTWEEFMSSNPIITKVTDVLSAVPDRAVLETLTRADSFEELSRASRRVTDCACRAAESVKGSKVLIENIMMYAPFHPDPGLMGVAVEVMEGLSGKGCVKELPWSLGSVDSGDLSQLKPTIYPYVWGAEGGFHAADFKVSDREAAYLLSSKFIAGTILRLLEHKASLAKKVKDEFTPRFASKEEYFSYLEGLSSKVEYP